MLIRRSVAIPHFQYSDVFELHWYVTEGSSISTQTATHAIPVKR